MTLTDIRHHSELACPDVGHYYYYLILVVEIVKILVETNREYY